MFGKLLSFELKLHTRQIGFWVSFVLVVLAAIGMSSFDFLSGGGERIKGNGAVPLQSLTEIFYFGSIFFAAIFTVTGTMRDDVHKSLELIHATPVQTKQMIWARFMGVWMATSLVLFAATLGLIAGPFMPWADKEAFQAFNAWHYLKPFLMVSVINALIVTAIYTVVAGVTRNRPMVYVSAVVVLMISQVAGLLSLQLDGNLFSSLLGPFGDTASYSLTEYWPPAEKNANTIPLMSVYGANRLLWLALAGLALFAGQFLFTRGMASGKFKGSLDDEGVAPLGTLTFAKAKTTDTFAGRLSQFFQRTKFESETTLRSTPFIVLSLVGLLFFVLTAFAQNMFNPQPVIPISSKVAIYVTSGFSLFIYIIMIFFAGEIVWRDRVQGMTEVLDATPVRNGTIMASKWASMFAIIAAALLFAIVCGMGIQLILGKAAVQPLVFFKSIFIAIGTPLFLFAALVLMIQSLAPGRVIGMVLSAVALVVILVFIIAFPYSHPLMAYGMVSTGGFSDMNGFGNMQRWGWFTLYWTLLAGAFAVLSTWLWRRGVEVGLMRRIRNLRHRIGLKSAGVMAACLVGFAAVGSFIYVSYENADYTNSKEAERLIVAYENSLAEKVYDPAPSITSVKSDVRFYPSERRADITGTFDLTNRYETPISEVYIAMRNYDDLTSISIAGATPSDAPLEEVIRPKLKSSYALKKELEALQAAAKEAGEPIPEALPEKEAAPLETKPSDYTLKEFGYRRFVFDPPLAPGDKSQLDFVVNIAPPVLGQNSPIIQNGTFVNHQRIFPIIGLQGARMTNPDKRRKYDLPELPKMPDRDDMDARRHNFFDYHNERVDFETVFCTDKGQTAVAPGRLVREYEEGGQACFDYKTKNPIANFFAFVSANYLEESETYKGVKLRILYDKAHPYNVEKMMTALKTGLDSFQTRYGPYQHDHVRILEFPYRGFAQSYAGTIPFSENIGFIQEDAGKDGEKVDLMTYVTHHELGHQYFGHQILPAQVKGFNVLSETLSENAALTALEDQLGWEQAKRRRDRSADQYLMLRTTDRNAERPLGLVENSMYTWYQKGMMVVWGLSGYMGRDNVDLAMQDLLAEYRLKEAPYPTTLDLVSVLKGRADPSLHGFIDDSFEKLTFWDLKIKDQKAVPNSDGGYDVSFTLVTNKKYASEETGKETDADALQEIIEIGVFKDDPKDTVGGEAMLYKRITVTEKETPINVTVDEVPAWVMADPRAWLIERNVKDNAEKLDTDKRAEAK